MKKYFILYVLLSTLLIACDCKEDSSISTDGTMDHLMFGTLYQQYSPEYKALCIQGYNLATQNIQEIMANTLFEVAPAVVLDLDETVLDNSPFEAKCILENTSYPEFWDEWMNIANADLVPGAKDFLEFATAKGVEVYYISNRKIKYLQQTIDNMKKHNLPNADSAHIWLRTDTSSKKARRDTLARQRSIVMLIGDNLNDFTEAFELEDNQERIDEVYKMESLFGKRFIMLPNPMYGEWEKAVLNNSYDHNRAQRDSLYKNALKGF